jgi:hydrogenase maturation protein HypF
MAEVEDAEPLAVFHLDGLESRPLQLPVDEIIRGAAQDIADGATPAMISASFHRTLLDLFLQVVLVAQRETGLSDVILGGGVFQNDILMRGMWLALTDFDLRPWRSLQCPPNDGVVALGQAAVARAKLR